MKKVFCILLFVLLCFSFAANGAAKDVYQIAELPSELRRPDVVTTAVVSFLMTLLATLYPSWRAAKVNPAEALRYE